MTRWQFAVLLALLLALCIGAAVLVAPHFHPSYLAS